MVATQTSVLNRSWWLLLEVTTNFCFFSCIFIYFMACHSAFYTMSRHVLCVWRDFPLPFILLSLPQYSFSFKEKICMNVYQKKCIPFSYTRKPVEFCLSVTLYSCRYCVAGTIGHKLMSDKRGKVDLDANTRIDVRCQVNINPYPIMGRYI